MLYYKYMYGEYGIFLLSERDIINYCIVEFSIVILKIMIY